MTREDHVHTDMRTSVFLVSVLLSTFSATYFPLAHLHLPAFFQPHCFSFFLCCLSNCGCSLFVFLSECNVHLSSLSLCQVGDPSRARGRSAPIARVRSFSLTLSRPLNNPLVRRDEPPVSSGLCVTSARLVRPPPASALTPHHAPCPVPVCVGVYCSPIPAVNWPKLNEPFIMFCDIGCSFLVQAMNSYSVFSQRGWCASLHSCLTHMLGMAVHIFFFFLPAVEFIL